MPDDMDERHRDELLVEQARRGDTAALVQFATRWWAPIYRICWNMLGNSSDAATLTEDALLTNLRSSQSDDVPLRISLYRSAIGLTLVRSRSGPGGNGGRTRIREALERLDDLDRASVILRDVEGFPLHEVASILRASPAEIRSRAHRARLLLIGFLGDRPRTSSALAG